MGATRMLLGETSPAVQENRAFGVQSLSGTGALRYWIFIIMRLLPYQIKKISKTLSIHRTLCICNTKTCILIIAKYLPTLRLNFWFQISVFYQLM